MIQPLGDRVLCRPVATDEHMAGGTIVLMEGTRANLTSEQAEVVAVGPEAHGLKAGDWVLHKPFARKEAPDEQFWLAADDILAVLE